jgi:hypothetical protein
MGWQDDPIVTDRPKWESDPIISSAPSESATTLAAPMIDIKAGSAMPMLIAPSANPYSAGRYPLGRLYTVGDAATYRRSDILTGLEESIGSMRVTRVDYDEDLVEYNNGGMITDLMGNLLKEGPIRFNVPRQWVPTEFQLGKKWTAIYRRTEKGRTLDASIDMRIVKRETISVPAGTFDAFLIEGAGLDYSGTSAEVKQWLTPGINFVIRLAQINRYRSGGYHLSRRWELRSLRQQTVDLKCVAPADGLHRNLVIKSSCV